MDRLKRECAVLTRHLIGQPPNEYVVAKYAEYHALPEARRVMRCDVFDQCLLTLATMHPAATLLTDAYLRNFRPASVLRKKLVLLLAILETCAPTYEEIDAVKPAGPVRLGARLALGLGIAGLVFLASVLLLGPCHLLAFSAAAVRRTPGVTVEVA